MKLNMLDFQQEGIQVGWSKDHRSQPSPWRKEAKKTATSSSSGDFSDLLTECSQLHAVPSAAVASK